jgi:hypothetical protein
VCSEACSRAEVDAVQNQIQIFRVRLDLRMVDFADGILDRELVEMKDVSEDFGSSAEG